MKKINIICFHIVLLIPLLSVVIFIFEHGEGGENPNCKKNNLPENRIVYRKPDFLSGY